MKFALSLVALLITSTAAAVEYDVVVYGGTSAAVTAAVQAAKMNKSVIIVSPDKHLGGLTGSGLGFTDTGDKRVIGGLSREFYHRVWQAYQRSETWRWQKRDEYGNKGQGTPAIDGEHRTMWIFEPRVAEQVFEDFVRDYKIPVERDQWLDRTKGVTRQGDRITSITTLNGRTYAGKMFIDATYEGDLMATAGVKYHVGRESQKAYGEKWAGVQTGVLHHRHHFGALTQKVDPYVVPGDPQSGVLPRVSAAPPGEYGAGDNKVQAYCYRMCLTNLAENRLPFPKPANYDPKQYELLIRIYQAGWKETFDKFDPIPNHKTDTNNHGPMSTDNIGFNYDYPEASYERRREILEEHKQYQQGWLYFIANDPRVPKDVQARMRSYGLPKDEFLDNGHWPHQIYVREARRMIGSFVMTEHELIKTRPTPESVGMGSYGIDSHNIQRYITPEGAVQNEGDIGVSTRGPYQIAYGSLVPKRSEGSNLFVPVALSSTHVAYGSIRMEPVFMILGQSAATAAVLAIEQGHAVQDVPYGKLRERLLADGQILEVSAAQASSPEQIESVSPAKLAGIVIDEMQAELVGSWSSGNNNAKRVGPGYRHDGNTRDGRSTARFEAKLPAAGRYDVRLAYIPNENRATNVPVEVHSSTGVKTITLNQRVEPGIGGLFVSLGIFEFTTDKPAAVVITNRNTDGYVVVDAVQWVSVK